LVLSVGIVGHRHLANDQTAAFIRRECLLFLKQLRANEKKLRALSAIAEGADTLFAEAALELGIPLDIVRPFRDYAADFEKTQAKERYQKLRAAARSEKKLNYRERSDKAYGAAMNWIVTNSNVLVIAWNRLPARGPGGTGSAVGRVVQLNRSWLHLDVSDLSVRFHPAREGRAEN
jgi:hypothetical protein